ncbi:MAG TPA: PQQ-dependent sugar dehydrogenase, partial [Naasia sp.]
MRPRAVPAAAALSAALLLAACAGPGEERRGTPAPAPTSSPAASTSPSPEPASGPLQPAGAPETVVGGLAAPWSVVPVEGSVLISQRDAGTVVEATGGTLREVGPVEGVVPG